MIDIRINNILKVYDSLYRPLFLNPPAGVVFFDDNRKSGSALVVQRGEDGQGIRVTTDESNRRIYRNVFTGIINGAGANVIRQAPKIGEDGMGIDTSWMNPDGSMKYNYIPYTQIRNCNGIYRDKNTKRLVKSNSYSEFRKILQAGLKVNVKKLLKRVDTENDDVVDRALESIQSLYTTIVIANEFDTNKNMRFSLSLPDIKGLDDKKANEISRSIINANPLGMSLDQYKLMNSSVSNNIVTTLIVTDEKRYKGEVLFAYKLIGKLMESGASVNLKNAVVGTKINGDSYSVNLADTANTIISVIAGSGSGKGVLTLALLAYMIGAKSPVVYVDYKPDMATALWDMKNANGGVGILAVDGAGGGRVVKDANGEMKALEPGWGTSSELGKLLVGNTDVIPYVKAIQLMNLMARYRVDRNDLKKNKSFFILDEAQKAGKAIEDSQKALTQVLSEYNKTIKDLKDSATEEQKQAAKDLKRIIELFKGSGNAVDTFQKTNGRSGNMSAIVLGQAPEAGGWPDMFYNAIGGSPLRFLGAGTYNEKSSTKVGVGKDVEGARLIGRGYFAVCTSSSSNKDNTTVIKTAMVLNDADGEDGQYVGSLLKNLADDVKDYVIADDIKINENNVKYTKSIGLGEDSIGQDNPLVGFPGLIKYLGAAAGSGFDINRALQSGEEQLEMLLKKLGIMDEGHYQSVESYLYSAKSDSIFTNGELQSALLKGINIYEYIDGNTGEESDFSGDGAKQAVPGEVLELTGSEEPAVQDTANTGNQEVRPESTEDGPVLRPGETFEPFEPEKKEEDNGIQNMRPGEVFEPFEPVEKTDSTEGTEFTGETEPSGTEEQGSEGDVDSEMIEKLRQEQEANEAAMRASEEVARHTEELMKQLESNGKILDNIAESGNMDEINYKKYSELRQRQEEALQQVRQLNEVIKVGLLKRNDEPAFNITNSGNVTNITLNNYNTPELQGHVEKMSAKNSIRTTFDLGRQSVVAKVKSMRSLYGGTEEIFRELLRKLKERGIRLDTVGYLRIANNECGGIAVGKRVVDYNGFLNANELDGSTLRPSDIVSIKVISKEFKKLNSFELDNESLRRVYSELNKHGKTGLGYAEIIDKIFKSIPSLVELIYYDASGQKQVVQRSDLNMNRTMAAIDKLEEQNKVMARLEAASMSRGNGNGLARKVRANQTVAYMKASGLAKNVPKNVAKYGAMSLGTYAIGSLIFPPVAIMAAVGTGIYGIRQLINMNKPAQNQIEG